MTWPYLALAGLLIGPLIYWFARWAPYKIEQQESEWLRELSGVHKPPALRPVAPIWHSSFWSEALGSYLFWLGLVGGCVLSTVFGIKFQAMPMVFFALAMLCLAMADQYSQYLPDVMTLSLMWIGLLVQLLPNAHTVGIEAAVIGAATGYGLLWIMAKMFLLLRKQEGLGHGDMKLLAAAGAWLGPLALPVGIFLGSAFAIIYQGVRFLRRKSSANDLFPFGPWLALGVILAALFI